MAVIQVGFCKNLCKENDKSVRLWGHFSFVFHLNTYIIYFNAVWKMCATAEQLYRIRISCALWFHSCVCVFQVCVCVQYGLLQSFLSNLSPWRQNAKDKLHREKAFQRIDNAAYGYVQPQCVNGALRTHVHNAHIRLHIANNNSEFPRFFLSSSSFFISFEQWRRKKTHSHQFSMSLIFFIHDIYSMATK